MSEAHPAGHFLVFLVSWVVPPAPDRSSPVPGVQRPRCGRAAVGRGGSYRPENQRLDYGAE